MRAFSRLRFPPYPCILVCLLLSFPCRVNAATAAGTAISETATATYTNAALTGFTATGNVLTTYVQNAPSMTMSTPTGQNISLGVAVTDTFTFTNTGNGTGAFALTGNATFAGTATGTTTLTGYVLNAVPTGTCSTASPCSYSTLNAQSGMANIAANGTVTVGVVYTASSSDVSGTTIQSSLTANIVYAAGTGTTAQTSSNVTSTPTDTVYEPRIDVQTSASTPGNSGAAITWTVAANNGGSAAAFLTHSACELVWGDGCGHVDIIIFVKLPTFNGSVLGGLTAPSITCTVGCSGGTYARYSTSGSPPTTSGDWSSSLNAAATWISVDYSLSASSLPSNPTGSTGAGSVSSSQLSFTFTTNQPSGTGSGNSASVSAMANTVADDVGGYVIGPGIAAGTADSNTASQVSPVETNAVSSSGITPPGGASNQIGDSAFVGYTLVNGPYGVAAATGLYPGASSSDNMHDYTAYNVPCTSNSSAGVNGLACTVSATGVIIVNEVDNTGNSSDSVKITASAPSGYLVRLYAASACSGGGSSVPSCTQGASLTSQSTNGGSVNATVTVASGAAYYYEAVYNANANSATPFTAYTTKLTAAGQSGTGTGTDTNDTYNVLYPGGVVQLASAVTATTTHCPAGESAPPSGLACPGGTLSYTVVYTNVVPANVAGANLGTEPVFAYNPCYTVAGSLVITDDGTANPSGATAANNWPTYTNNIAAAATDTTANTVITYYPSASTTYSAAQNKFTAKIGGASYQLPPGGSGTVTFTAVVK